MSDCADHLDVREQCVVHARREACACVKALAMLGSGIRLVPLHFACGGARHRRGGGRHITRRVASSVAALDRLIAAPEHARTPERASRKIGNETEAAFERLRLVVYR